MFLYSVVLLVAVSCSDSGKGFNEDDYPTTELFFQAYSIEPILGMPNIITVIDSVLLVNDIVDNRSLLLYNMTDSSYVRTLLRGNGPGEVISPINISVDEKEHNVFVFQRRNGELRTYSLDALLNDSIENYQKVNLGTADRAVPISGGYLGSGLYEDGMLHFCDANGVVKQVEDPYPESDIEDMVNKYVLFQGSIAYNVANNCVILAPSFASSVLFYRNEGGVWKNSSRFQLGNGSLERKAASMVDYRPQKDDIDQCRAVCSSGNFFYVLYDGARLDGVGREKRYVLRFNASTEQLEHVYVVDPTVVSVCVYQGKLFAL